jgi:hypothetical protein
MNGSDDVVVVSEYEKLRLENIARNQQFLKEIGLSTLVPTASVTSSLPLSIKKRKNASTELQPPIPLELCRRSSRVAKLTQEHGVKESTKYNDEEPPIEVDRVFKRKSPSAPRPAPTPSADSARARNAYLDEFLGDKLGRLVDSYGKAAVMAEANSGTLPKFSKYSGVAEWRNCVFLWVNIFDPTNGGGEGIYPNEFYEGGRHMSWFGGSRMTEHSEVVQRLVRAGSKDGSSVTHVVDDQIILFVRLEGENYSCFGRLKIVSCELERSPVKFVWELLDFDRLKNEEQMKRVLKTSRCSTTGA